MTIAFAPDSGGSLGRLGEKLGGRPDGAPLRIVTFTTLYPNNAQPHHGIFVENRLRHLVASGKVEVRVVAPVPWFPFAHSRFGRYGDFARASARESRFGLPVLHPRYPVLPKFGMSLAPALLYAASLPVLKRLQAERDFDLIDAHYLYPDGVAAVLLGRSLGKPVVLTARGTDVNLIPRHALPRRMIRWAASRADAVITVAEALRAALVALEIDPARVHTLRNGVDLAQFRPLERQSARVSLGLGAGPVLLSVGHLVARKGHRLVIEALAGLPGYSLLIAGEGPERAALAEFARRLGLDARVRFLGAVPHENLAAIYSAADALALASSREGWPNVLLESLACGTPVVASRAWGNPEIVADPVSGVLMPELSAAGVVGGVTALFRALPARAAVRAYAENFSWDATTAGQIELFTRVLAGRSRAAVMGETR
jgi:teichuronic acid biosynthesis glycosyltransferase TuaC